TPITAKHTKRKRCIGPGDQEEDRRVIENLEYALRAAPRQRVKERGCEIQQHHGSREHARAHGSRGIATVMRGYDENREGSPRRQLAKTMANAVRDFLSDGLWPLFQLQRLQHRRISCAV